MLLFEVSSVAGFERDEFGLIGESDFELDSKLGFFGLFSLFLTLFLSNNHFFF